MRVYKILDVKWGLDDIQKREDQDQDL